MMPTEQQQARPTWMHGAAMMTIWWPVMAFVCLSINTRIQAKYFAGLLVASGIEGAPAISDVLFLYRQDLILFGVILPLFTAWCFVRMRFVLAAAVSGLLVLATQALLYANLQSWGQVGSFLTWQALSNAVSFGLSKPEFVGEYLAPDGMVKLAVLILASAGVLVAGRLVWSHQRLIRLWGVAGWLSAATFALLSVWGHGSAMRAAPISGSFVANAMTALADNGASAATPPQPRALGQRYAALSGISGAAYQGPNFGVHKDSNLLLFVMETASIEFLDTRSGLPSYPVLDALKERLFVANNHFSTFPASAEGNLSILTGAYPPRAIYGTCLIDVPRKGGRLPGPIAQLRDAGYHTAIYAPYQSQVPADKVVFEGTGFAKVTYGEKLEGSTSADQRTFDRLLNDIAGWTSAKQPFAAAFLPQVGHGPWPATLGNTIRDRGARVVGEQLGWLGRIVETLRANGQLDNTVIVITGDHGVRTSVEDPRVKVGMIDWYSFHVPMLLFAPRADYSGVDSAMASSHVDLAPELGELFGLESLQSYQGLALHNPERANRRGFLMAGWYYGANGYRDAREVAMYSDMLDAAYERHDGTVAFGTAELVKDAHRRAVIRSSVSAMAALQEAWIKSRLCR